MRRPVVVINIYRPPSGTITAAFEHIREVLDNDLFNRSKCDVVILGDFNLDATETSPHVSIVDNFVRESGFMQVINTPTRTTRLTKTIIDLLFVKSDNICKTGVINYHCSDHLSIYLVKKRLNVIIPVLNSLVGPTINITSGSSRIMYSTITGVASLQCLMLMIGESLNW